MGNNFLEGYDAVIFDLDGVIINSEPIHMDILNDMVRPYGGELETWDYNENFVGKCEQDCWGEIKRRYQIPYSVEELIERYVDGISRYFETTQNPPVLPGVRELVGMISAKKRKLAVASSSSKKNIMLSLKSAGIRDYFDALASAEDAGRGKPAPDVYLNACEALEVQPHKGIAIEDSAAGVKAAKAAGLYAIGLKNPDSGEQDLSLADRVVGSLEELLQ
ncbi:HAD family hydrolase [Christensenella timonensis]|uniref:HAD family hydrolase n=1 Tax=Christensenella timonensis TaxID=1816678 RepID=UPI00082F50F9|nr:HAD-IA family hydrolase [Christensenella timonensis]